MKVLKVICLISIINISILSAQQFTDYRVPWWYNDKSAAFNISFDDRGGLNTLPILDSFNFPATFFHYADDLAEWDTLRAIVLRGHEVGNHNINHTQDTQTIRLALERIEAEIPNYKVVSMAWAGGGHTSEEDIIAYELGMLGGRVAGTGPTFGDQWRSTYFAFAAFSSDGGTASSLAPKLDTILKYKVWGNTFMHGIDLNDFRGMMAELDKRKDSMWIATFGDIIKYYRERRFHILEKISEDNSQLTLNLSITDSVNHHIDSYLGGRYEQQHKDLLTHPLTLIIKVDMPVVEVRQNEQIIPHKVKSDSIIINAIPGGGNIVITKDNTSEINEQIIDFSIYPNPTKSYINIKLNNLKQTNIYNLNGILLSKSHNSKIDLNALPSGVYIIKCIDYSGEAWVKLITKI